MIRTIQNKDIPLSLDNLEIYELNNSPSYPYYALYDYSLITDCKDKHWGSSQVVVKFISHRIGHVVASNYPNQLIGYTSNDWNLKVFYYITDKTKIKFPNIYSLQSI